MNSTLPFEQSFAENFRLIDFAFDPRVSPLAAPEHGITDELVGTGIHNLWHESNFRDYALEKVDASLLNSSLPNNLWREAVNPGYDYPRQLYNRMKPALRLTTRLLDRARYCLMRVAYAPVSDDLSYLTENMVVTEKMEDHFDELLEYLADGLMFFHHRYNTDSTRPMKIEARFDTIGTYAATTGPMDVTNTKLRIIMSLSDELLKAYANPDWDVLPFYHRDSLAVFFANTLIHELAHAIFRLTHPRYRGRHEPDSPFYHEPALFRGSTVRELGLAVQEYLFGGVFNLPMVELPDGVMNSEERFQPVWDGSWGLLFCMAPQISRPHLNWIDGDERYFASPNSLRALLSTSTYERTINERDHFDLPKQAPFIMILYSYPTFIPRDKASIEVDFAVRTYYSQRAEAGNTEGISGYVFQPERCWWWRRQRERYLYR